MPWRRSSSGEKLTSWTNSTIPNSSISTTPLKMMTRWSLSTSCMFI
jgi:hypothetical protein